MQKIKRYSQYLSIIIAVWGFLNLKSLLYVLDFLFVTKDTKLNWIGITGIIAIFGLLYNLYDGRRRFMGDLRSKSRIDWMKSVRPLVAEYVTDVSKYMYLYHMWATDKDAGLKSNYNIQMTEKMEGIRNTYYAIKLYVPNNESNALLLKNIELLFGELTYIGEYYDYGIGHGKFISSKQSSNYEEIVDQYISKLLITTIEDGSKYFKKEWEVAKSGN